LGAFIKLVNPARAGSAKGGKDSKQSAKKDGTVALQEKNGKWEGAWGLEFWQQKRRKAKNSGN